MPVQYLAQFPYAFRNASLLGSLPRKPSDAHPERANANFFGWTAQLFQMLSHDWSQREHQPGSREYRGKVPESSMISASLN